MRILPALTALGVGPLFAASAAADPGDRLGGTANGRLPPSECRSSIQGLAPGQEPPPLRCGMGQRELRGEMREEQRIREYFRREFVRLMREREARESRAD